MSLLINESLNNYIVQEIISFYCDDILNEKFTEDTFIQYISTNTLCKSSEDYSDITEKINNIFNLNFSIDIFDFISNNVIESINKIKNLDNFWNQSHDNLISGIIIFINETFYDKSKSLNFLNFTKVDLFSIMGAIEINVINKINKIYSKNIILYPV